MYVSKKQLFLYLKLKMYFRDIFSILLTVKLLTPGKSRMGKDGFMICQERVFFSFNQISDGAT